MRETMKQGSQPKEVSETTNHGGEAPGLRERIGAEPCVWTERMLAALVNGVKGGKWFSLKDKLYRTETLMKAAKKVCSKRSKGKGQQRSIERFQKNLEREIANLQRELMAGTYRPSPVKRVHIPKPGSSETRPLGVPTIRDRVVQTALKMVIGPIFEIGFAESSYGFRPKRGCKDALREVNELLEGGYEWIVDADLKSYFDTIDHDRLMERVREKIADGLVLDLVEGYLKQGVLTELNGWEPTETGTPQGAVVSPLLANLYLNELDHLLEQEGYRVIRYADDFVVLTRTREEADKALAQVREWTEVNALILHPEKTRLVTHREGFDFLGYRFVSGRRYVRKKSLLKIRETIRQKTKRTNGQCMPAIIGTLNPILRGWYGYYQHAYKNTFPSMDGWVRMRLRSILRKRQKKRGRGRGRDHQIWPNRYFAEMGLFSLEQAHREACQSRSRATSTG